MKSYGHLLLKNDVRWCDSRDPFSVSVGRPADFLCPCGKVYSSTFLSNYCLDCKNKILNKVKKIFRNEFVRIILPNKIFVKELDLVIIVDFTINNKLIINCSEIDRMIEKVMFIRITENCIVNYPNWKMFLITSIINITEIPSFAFIDELEILGGAYFNFIDVWKNYKFEKLSNHVIKRLKR